METHHKIFVREETNKLQYADRLIVLRLRAIIGREKLNKMSAADIFKYGVDQGFIDFDGAKEIELDQVKVSGSLACATIAGLYKPDLKGFKPWLAFINDNNNN